MELKIEGVTYRPSVPITTSRTLDESLDSAHMVIPYTTRREPFVPFSLAELDGERWLVGADIPTEVKGLPGRWQHDLTLIEETKRMETLFVSSKVITKHEYRDYFNDQKFPEYEIVLVHDPSEEGYDDSDISPADIGVTTITAPSMVINSSQAVRNKGTYTDEEIAAFEEAVGGYSTRPYAIWVESGGNLIAYTESLTDPLSVNMEQMSGYLGNVIEIHYFVAYARTELAGAPMLYYELQYTVTPILIPSRTTNKTVEDVVVELIADAEQLRYGDEPRIRLDESTAERLRAIEAPEDAFTAGMSLYEALLKVGDWDGVGGIPRLRRDVLIFERWGATETATIKGRVLSVKETATAEDWCSSLESAAENMVDDAKDGIPVKDPFSGGYQTVRTEDGAVIIEDGAIRISTAFPIWQVVKLDLGYVGGRINAIGGDLTPYVYERSEYDLLSEYVMAGFPNSRAYALYYTKGASGIDGLSFVPRSIGGDLFGIQYNAINHILSVKFGKSLAMLLESKDIVNLPFRVTYIPYLSARIRQHKMRVDGVEALMPYGQGGSVISARTYGGHLRARAQMMGLPEKTMQVLMSTRDELPKPGQRIDAVNYIGTVTAEHYPTYRRCEITMSPNYNRINRFIQVDKDIRQFEIPMNGSTERNILTEDFIVMGSYEGRHGAMTSPDIEEATVKAIMGIGSSVEIGAVVCATSNNADKTDGVQVILPLSRIPIGNSVLFYTKYKDNYSAGTVSSYNHLVGDSRRMQRDIRYTDAFGGANYLHLDLVSGAAIGLGKDDVDTAHTVPMTAGVEVGRSMISTEDKPILLNKDARESISISYQMHYVTNTDLIIGEAMAARAPYLVSKTRSRARVYIYGSYINPLTGESVEPDGAAYLLDYGKERGVWYLRMPTVPAHVSWAVKQDGVFLFGANSSMPDKVYFNFRDKLREAEDHDTPDDDDNVFITYNYINARHNNIVDYIRRGRTLVDKVIPFDGCYLPNSVEVSMGGKVLDDDRYSWNHMTGNLSVPNVINNTEITVIAVANVYTVTPILTDHLTFAGSSRASHNSTYSCSIISSGEYKVDVKSMSVKVGDEKRVAGVGFYWDPDTNVLTIPHITGDVTIRAYAVSNNVTIEFEPFVSRFDGKFRVAYGDVNYTDLSAGLKLTVPLGAIITYEWFCPAAKLTLTDNEQDAMHVFGEESYMEVKRIAANGNGMMTFAEEEKPKFAVNVTPINCTYSPVTEFAYQHQKLLLTFKPNTGYSLPDDIVVLRGEEQMVNGVGYVFDKASGVLSIDSVIDSITVTVLAVEAKYNVIITLMYWNQDESEMMFTEEIRGQYPAGSVIEVPTGVTKEYYGQEYVFYLSGHPGKITVTSDINTSLNYIEWPDTPEPETYKVELTYEYRSTDETQLLDSVTVTGYYTAGSTIEIPREVSRTIDGESLTFESQYSDDSIIVISPVTKTIVYTVKQIVKYSVSISLSYYDSDGTELHHAKIEGMYEEGSTILIPASEVIEVDGEDVTFDLEDGEDQIIMVNGNINISYTYYIVE